MQVSVKKIFCIPSHILLPEDAIQAEQYTEADMQNIDNEIGKLTSRYRRVRQ